MNRLLNFGKKRAVRSLSVCSVEDSVALSYKVLLDRRQGLFSSADAKNWRLYSNKTFFKIPQLEAIESNSESYNVVQRTIEFAWIILESDCYLF